MKNNIAKRKAFEKWALPHLNKIQKILLLGHFVPLNLKYATNLKPDVMACFNFSHPYQSISIEYSDLLLKEWDNKDYNNLYGVLAHELSHALTDPLYDSGTRRFINLEDIKNEREKLTDHIANIVITAFPL